ncbi:MAG: di-heme-cytochrome C peroxidase [Planctomycetaceae bacterium]
MIRRFALVLCGLLPVVAGCSKSPPGTLPVTDPPTGGVALLSRSDDWTGEERKQFYSQDQGSQLIPLRWFLALTQPNGKPFSEDHLSRYGYLKNELDPTSVLPIGFTQAGPVGEEHLGLTCAACHTRQIEIDGKPYRIDGGPALSDFQGFLADLDQSVQRLMDSPEAFTEFADQVLSPQASNEDRAALKTDVETWFKPFHTITSRSLPTTPWGVGRLDAVGMIFNRVTGLDIGTGPDHMIPENIQVADAPVRYPFLWNAARQDYTQWPGFAANGNDILGLARNLGEVYGVFASFHPEPAAWIPLFGVDYVKHNSANFRGLATVENLIGKIPPPRFPGKIDPALRAEGERIFNRPNKQDGCVECHGIVEQPGLLGTTWKTPIQNVGTDIREAQLLLRTARTGVLEGVSLPRGTPLKAEEPAFNILRTVVVGAIVQAPFRPFAEGLESVAETNPTGLEAVDLTADMARKLEQLRKAFPKAEDLQSASTEPGLESTAPQSGARYESRVMQGIWAAAPYLHNGSVPTLADLLEPVEKRPAEFEVGADYNLERVGLERKQKKLHSRLVTTDAARLDSGNSRAGHEFGTKLSPSEKKALLEYLKSL